MSTPRAPRLGALFPDRTGYTIAPAGQCSTGWRSSSRSGCRRAGPGNVTQTGTAVTASNLSYNGMLAPGASTSFGFNGTHTGSTAKPTTFTLNGSPCAVS
ncbi:cellulose binding domain-containing protein [Micromonospora aurantiaca (nom. illeg.)]|uniref:cellulose binding domain-containing protein n=1 Tax=Micromonospora aurantiaca (nom. illeg.) TaxID=47850 RepID=UPI0037B7B9CC